MLKLAAWNPFNLRVVSKRKLTEEIEETVSRKVDDALLEERRWSSDDVGVGTILPNEASVFESVTLFNAPLKSKGKTELKEAEGAGDTWLGVGSLYLGDELIEQTVEKLRLAQIASVYQWIMFPVARSIIENYKRYCIGRGVKFDCVVSEIHDYIKRFWLQNDFETYLRDAFADLLLEGEVFTAFFDVSDSKKFVAEEHTPVLVRRIYSGQISDVEYDVDDYTCVLGYTRTMSAIVNKGDDKYYLDIAYNEGEQNNFTAKDMVAVNTDKTPEAARMYMMKYGRTFDRRGRVFLESVLRWIRVYSDFVYDRGRINHLRTKIFLIKTVTTKSGSRSSDGFMRMPKGGVMLVETNDRKYRMESPNTGATEAKEDALLLLHMIASGVSMPEYIIIQDAANNNYASIREAGTPFIQAVTDLRDTYAEHIKKMLKYVIKVGVEKGILQPEYTVSVYPGDAIGEVKKYINAMLDRGESITNIVEAAKKLLPEQKEYTIRTIDAPIDIIFPDVVKVDSDKQAATIQIYRTLRLMSRHTAIQVIGYDPDVEMSRIEKEESETYAKDAERFAATNNDRNPNDAGSVDNEGQ